MKPSHAVGVTAFSIAGMLAAYPWAAAPARGAEASTQLRTLAPFTRIRSNGAFAIRVTAGAVAQRVTVSGDPGVVAQTTTAVDGDTLVLGMAPGSYESSPTIEIAVATLHGFDDRGASHVTISGIAGPSFELADRGSSRTSLAGSVDRASLDVSGAGTVDARGLRARDVVVTDSGVAHVVVTATSALAATVSGVGEIRYCGSPARVERHVAGVGSIEPC